MRDNAALHYIKLGNNDRRNGVHKYEPTTQICIKMCLSSTVSDGLKDSFNTSLASKGKWYKRHLKRGKIVWTQPEGNLTTFYDLFSTKKRGFLTFFRGFVWGKPRFSWRD